MKRTFDIKSAVIGMLLSGALFFCVGSSTSGEAAAWEYKVLRAYEMAKLEPQLAQLGKNGWSVVASSEFHTQDEAAALTIILKRQIK